jgi:outer membrane protein assembly factor BamB
MLRVSLAALFACAMLSACGGGSSSPAPAAPQTTMSLSTNQVAVNAYTTDATAPTASLQVTVTNPPAAGLYYAYRANTSIISNLSVTSSTATTASVTIVFAPPSAMAPGVYTDTLALAICLDSQCKTQVANSPQNVAVQYTVLQGNAATATPTITSLNPTSAVAGGPAFTLTIVGVNFAASSLVQWNGLPLTTTFTSSTQISAQVSAPDIAAPGSAAITVSNQSTGGGISTPASYVISPPAPLLTSISPSSVYAGAATFTLTVNGSGFLQLSYVQLNGTALATTYVSGTQLTAQVPATAVAAVAVLPVVVSNQNAGGSASNTLSLSVGNAPLALTAISPVSVTAGGPAYVQTVVGTGFTSGSTVQWNGSARPTTYVSPTELLAQIGASDIASVGTASVDVVNTGATSGTTSALTVTIAAPSIDAVSFQIDARHSGVMNFATIVASTSLPTAATWSVNLGGMPSYALIAGGKVFVTVSLGGGTSELFALSQATGATVWGPTLISGFANAAYDGGKVFVLSATIGSVGLMQAFDAATGALLWSASLTSQYSFTGPPTAADGMVYVMGAGGGETTYAVDQNTGALVWTALIAAGDDNAPAVTADGVYVSAPCLTYDYRPLTGEVVWSNNTGCDGGGGATGVVANGLYLSPNGFGSYSGQTFNAETGGLAGAYVATNPPAVGTQTGYYLQSGTLRAVSNSSNTVLWSFAGDGTLTSSPILVNNYVFVGGTSGNLYMLDATSGTQLQVVNLGAAIPPGPGWGAAMPISGLSAGDGLLIVPAGNTLSAFTLSTSP